MKKILTLLSVVCTTLSYAQNNGVILAPSYIPDIANPIPEPLPTNFPGNTNPNDPLDGYDGAPATSAQNIMVDSLDEIVFFIVDQYIYDKKGALIDVFNVQSVGSPYATGIISEIAVVPVPGECNSYYIISTQHIGSVSLAFGFYSKLTINYDDFGNQLSGSGLELQDIGNCVDKGISFLSLIGPQYLSENGVHDEGPRYAVVPKDDSVDMFLFVSNGSELFRLTVSETGITYDNYFINLNDLYPNRLVQRFLRGRLEIEAIVLNNGNYRLALPLEIEDGSGVNFGVYTFDLDINGILISGTQKTAEYFDLSPGSQFRLKGVELSPDGSRLYVSHIDDPDYPGSLDVFDLTPATPVKTIIENSDVFEFSQIEASFNNTVLLAHQNGLARISNANGAFVPANLNMNFVSLASYPASNPTGESINDFSVRLLQDQIDGFDYSTFETKTYGADYYRVSTNQTWSPNTIGSVNNPLNDITNYTDTAFIKNELRIEAGATLTINNMVLVYSPDARVVIENGVGSQQGGRLVMNNTTFTNENRCDSDSLWLGVEVWGNQSQKQNLSQGVLTMNDSRIENAWIGCLVGARTSYTQEVPLFPGGCISGGDLAVDSIVNDFIFDDALNGGIVVTTNNSLFYNNQRGVYFRPYLPTNGANNLSVFNNTDFLWEGFLKEGEELIQLAKLEEVKGIRFKGCRFENLTPDDYIIFEQGLGIHSTESQFHVSPKCNVPVTVGQPCPSETISSFKGLRIGIAVSNANGLSFSCTESEFINNQHGIRVFGSNNEKITENEFQIRELSNYQTSGIVASFSTGYTIEENNLTNFDNPFLSITDVESYGIVIRSSGPYTNKVYKNTFANLKIGAQAEKLNATTTGVNLGLEWQCNDFISNIDEHDMTLMRGSIKGNQGASNTTGSILTVARAAANNKFSLSGESPSLDHDLFVSTGSVNYEYNDISAPRHIPDSYTEQSGSNPVSFVQPDPLDFNSSPITNDAGTCPSKLGKKTIAFFKQQIEAFEEVIDDNLELIEDGAVEDLLEVIVEESPGKVRTELLKHSPYLSDEVLLAYIASNPPSGHLKQVMIANSQLSEQVKAALAAVNMPNGTANQIATAQIGVSERDKLVSEISYLTSEKDLLYSKMVSQLLLDEEEDANFDELIEILEDNKEDISSLKLLYRIYILLKDEQGALEVLVDLENLGVTPEFIEICRIQKELINKSSVDLGIEEDSLIQSRLQTVRTNISDERAGSNAACLLDIHGAPIVSAFLVESSAIFIGGNASQEVTRTDLSKLFEVSIYPNPSTGLVTFDFPDNEEGELKIIVIDLTGKIMHTETWGETNGQQIDLSHLHKGMYLVKISIDNVVVETQSLKLQ
tara:strand:+ start:1083 stop:5153 length:4071 start_codon:yes stop_codon:yes gene_type:complete